ncbi:MAG: chorismate mutase, partial [Lentisphaeria bacterium]|nr:chorismate mutase [Lentisphaeria bacterium]
MSLEKYRAELDGIDTKMLELFQERMQVVRDIAEYKKKNHTAVLDKSRERRILMRIYNEAKENMGRPSVALFRTIIEQSKAYQRELIPGNGKIAKQIEETIKNTPQIFPEAATVACMGVEGAYAQIACDRMFKVANIMYFRNFAGVFQAVEEGLCDYGLLPIDNTTSGTVDAVYDAMKKFDFHIVRSLRQQVSHVLMAQEGVKLSDIKEIFSHEQAFKQCGKFLKNLKDVQLTVSDSTATGAQIVAQSGRRDAAAIGAREAASLYGLTALPDNIQNTDYNYTRFICISRKPEIYPGANKISLFVVLPNKSGALHNVISKFAALDLNLTKLESRPTPGREFEYSFYLDFEAQVISP